MMKGLFANPFPETLDMPKTINYAQKSGKNRGLLA